MFSGCPSACACVHLLTGMTGLPSTSSCILHLVVNTGWLGSRVVGVLDSGTAGPGFKSGNSLRQTVHTHRASVH